MCRSAIAVLIGGLALVLALQPAAAASQPAFPTPLVVRAGDLRISEGVVAMSREGHVYLPVRALALALEFPVELDATNGRVSGWFLDRSRRYEIEGRTGEVRAEGRRRAFDPADFLTSQLADRHEIYARPRVLEWAWPVRLTVSRADLALEVEPLEPLPIQQRHARERRYEELRARNPRQDLDLPPQPNPYGWFGAPIVGVDVHARSGGGARAVRERIQWSQEMAGLNVAAGLFGSGPSLSESRLDDARLTVQRFAGDSDWPAGVEHIAAGDVSGENISRIGSVGTGRGVTVSSFPLVRASAYDLYRLEGSAPPGWDAELYRDGQLVGFQRVGEDGRYQFDGIELAYGANRLRVVLYGPQGQTRERTDIVDVGQTQARPGKTHFRIDHIEADRDFVAVTDQDRERTAGPGTSLRAVHGISRGLSLETGLVDLPPGRHLSGGRYGLIGAAGALGPTATRARLLGEQDGGRGIDLDTRIRGGPFHIRFGYGRFQNFESPRVGYKGSALTEDLELAASVPLTLGPAYMRLGARYGVAELVSGAERRRLNLSQRWNTGSVAWHHDVDLLATEPGTRRWSADLDASDRWFISARNSLLWTAGLSYAQDVGITEARLSARYLLPGATTVGLRMRGSDTGRTTVGADVTHQWDNARLSLTADGGNKADTRVGLRYSVGFGPTGGGSYALANPRAPQRGSLAVHAFVDHDGDGAYDAGEPPVPNARLESPLDRAEETGSDGRLAIHDLPAHRAYAVRLDPASLINPFWIPASDGRAIRVRPGSTPVVELPVEATGSISGTIELAPSGAGTAGVPVKLLNRAGETVARTRSIFGGFYSFDRVPYGVYEVRLDEAAGYAVRKRPDAIRLTSDMPMVAEASLSVVARSTVGGSRFANATEGGAAEREGASDRSEEGKGPARIVGRVTAPGDDGSHPAPDVRVRLIGSRGQVFGATRTDERGGYDFANLPSGLYRLHLPGHTSGPVHTTDVERGHETRVPPIALPSDPAPVRDAEGGSRIQGAVLAESGGDRCPVNGIPIRLLDERGQVLQQARSRDGGRYRFEGVSPGHYRVDVTGGAKVFATVRGNQIVRDLDLTTTGRAPDFLAPNGSGELVPDEHGVHRWITEQPQGRYAIELASRASAERATAFIVQNGLAGRAITIRTTSRGESRYRVYYGSFSQRSTAVKDCDVWQENVRDAAPVIVPIEEIAGTSGAGEHRMTAGGPKSESGPVSWLMAQPSSRHTIQLIGAHREEKIQSYVRQHRLTGRAVYVEVQRDGRPWFIVLYGLWDTRAGAQSARESLPAALQAPSPWVRTIGDIQAELSQDR